MSESNPSKRAATSSPSRQDADKDTVESSSSSAAAAASGSVDLDVVQQDPSTKRVKLDHQSMENQDGIQEVKEKKGEKQPEQNGSGKPPLTEKDVGISCYIEPNVPPFEGIIKQRFSDFQVFEVPLSKDPTSTSTSSSPSELHITSLLPPPGELLNELLTLEAEEKDPSLRAKRFDEEAERRSNASKEKIRQEQLQREFEKTWPGDQDQPLKEGEGEGEGIDEKLEKLFGKRVREEMKVLWCQGREVPKELVVVEDQDEEEEKSQSSDRGGRGGRGRGRGGKGKGRGRDGRGGAKKDPRFVTTDALVSKESRTEAHQLIREIFGGRFSSETTEISKPPTAEEEEEAAANGSEPVPSKEKQQALIIRWSGTGGNARWQTDPTNSTKLKDDHPKYIRFLLQKTNRDSHDSLTILGKSLGLHGKSQKDLSVAGTKDRRGVTIQEITFQRGRKTLDEVYKLINGIGKEKDGGSSSNRRGGRGGGGRGGGRFGFGSERKTVLEAVRERGERGMRIAHLEYTDKPLGLGDLNGNKFVIALRNVKVEKEETIHKAMKVLEERGFINYYGMQRFGTSFISTHQIGIPIFKAQFEEACNLLLQPSPEGTGSPDVEEAKKLYAQGKLDKAVYAMPRNRVAEKSILEFLKKAEKDGQKGVDWKGAFQTIPKTLRLMYLHAYQSYLWNRMVSARIQRFGSEKAIAGDYVYVDKTIDDTEGVEEEGLDLSGNDQDEDVVSMDVDVPEEQKEEAENKALGKSKGGVAKVKILTEEEAQSTSILDVLMPMPGSEVNFQEDSWLNKLYLEMLNEDGLTPEEINMSKVSEYALRGSYRKMIRKPSNTSYELIRYTDPNIALCQSDEDKILGIDPVPDSDPEGEFLALLVRFTLGTSSYATMALREVLKADTSSNFQKEMTRKSEDQKWKGNGGGGGRRDHSNGNARGGFSDRGRDRERAHVNKVSGQKQRQWGSKSSQDQSSTTNQETTASEVHVSEAAAEAFRKAREQMEREKEDEAQ